MTALFRSVDIASLVFFRIVFGILCFIDVLGIFFYYHLWKNDFHPNNFQFKYYGFEWVQAFPEPFMSIFLISVALAALAVAFGWRYKWSIGYFFLGFTYLFLLEKGHYLNHGYLICWLSFVLIWLPANAAFSIDVLHKPSIRRKEIPYINVFVLVFLMSIVYFFGGIAKINSDWLLHAQPLKIWLKQKAKMPYLGALWAKETTAWVMSWCGMLLDLLVVFFLLSKRTRWWAFSAVVGFHIVNMIIFKIGIFPWLSLALTLLFFPTDLPRRWVDFLSRKLKYVSRWQEKWQAKVAPIVPKETTIYPKKTAMIGLTILVIIHVFLPVRHHFFKGDVAWNEEGHRYAWRMMLRQKNGHGYFILKNTKTGETERINPRKYLRADREQDSLTWFSPAKNYLINKHNFSAWITKNPARKMYTHPDMVLQFAHHLRDEWCKKGWEKVEVYAHIRCKLNQRKYQKYIDETVDLAKIEWSFLQHSDWIIDLRED